MISPSRLTKARLTERLLRHLAPAPSATSASSKVRELAANPHILLRRNLVPGDAGPQRLRQYDTHVLSRSRTVRVPLQRSAAYVMGAGLNNANSLCKPQRSAQVCLRPLATLRISWKICSPTC